jgi:Winged helix DNA-binding domain
MSSAAPRIGTSERRARIAVRHHLAPAARAATPEDAAADIVGLHASDPTSVYLQALARVDGLTLGHLEDALYQRRTLLKFLGMRRTMFLVPRDLAAITHAACTRAIAARERKRLVGYLAGAGIGGGDPERWLDAVEADTVAALEALGEATAAELTKRVPGLREQIPFGAGKAWQGTVGVSTRLLFLLAAEGRIIRGRPRGTWVSSLYRWAPVERWIGGPLPEHPTGEAQVALVSRWLRAFGPGTERDLAWWTGLTLGEVRRAVAAQDPPAVEVALDEGAVGLAVADDLAPTPDPGPWIALLPALDATTMGWTDRSFFLGEHGPRLFDRNGNAGPTIWVDGRVVGGWAQRSDGEVVTHLLEDVGAQARAAIETEAARIAGWLGPTRVIPRFRTPLERELSA